MAKYKKDKPTSRKLREVLPTDQQKGLSKKALDLTGRDIEKLAKSGKINAKLKKELLGLAVKRINQGQTIFPYSSMEFDEANKADGDPQW